MTRDIVRGPNDRRVLKRFPTSQLGQLTVPIVRGATRAQLDLSMQYINGGRARYLAPGNIVDLQGGEVRISSLESTTHLVMLRIGARIGL